MSPMNDKIDKMLTSRGMTPRLIASTREEITPELFASLPATFPHSFGLMGSTGVGKSCAAAWQVRNYCVWLFNKTMKAHERENALTEEKVAKYYFSFPDIFWVYWPDCALAYQDANRFGQPVPTSVRRRPEPSFTANFKDC